MAANVITDPPERLRFALSGLGTGYLNVVVVLRAEGIGGMFRHPCHCPIAHYLAKRFPGSFRVFPTYVEWDYDGMTYYASLPPGVMAFMSIFDTGNLRSLVKTYAGCGAFTCSWSVQEGLPIPHHVEKPTCLHMDSISYGDDICDDCWEEWRQHGESSLSVQ